MTHETNDMPDEIYACNTEDGRVWEYEEISGVPHRKYIRSDLAEKKALDVEALKDALRDVLKAIVSDRHAVQDTIWVNGTPVGDFIMCALDEEIDLDELQNAPYRCKATAELPLSSLATARETELRAMIKGMREALENLMGAVSDMPADPEECWPEEWKAADKALSEADRVLNKGEK